MNNFQFTTIRGKNYNLFIGNKLDIVVNGSHYCYAEVIDKKIIQLCLIPLKTLKLDGNYSGFFISNHNDFLNLINSFTVQYNYKRTLNDYVSLFLLKKIQWNDVK